MGIEEAAIIAPGYCTFHIRLKALNNSKRLDSNFHTDQPDYKIAGKINSKLIKAGIIVTAKSKCILRFYVVRKRGSFHQNRICHEGLI